MILDYLKGFGLVIGLSFLLAVIAWVFLLLAGANIKPGETFELIMMVCLLIILTVGGQTAFTMLFDRALEKDSKFSVGQILGGFSAWVAAFYMGPHIISYFDRGDTDDPCETIAEQKFGPVTFSIDDCE